MLQLLLKAAVVYRSYRDSCPYNTVPVIKVLCSGTQVLKQLLLSFPGHNIRSVSEVREALFSFLPKINGAKAQTLRAEGDPASQQPSKSPFPHSPRTLRGEGQAVKTSLAGGSNKRWSSWAGFAGRNPWDVKRHLGSLFEYRLTFS